MASIKNNQNSVITNGDNFGNIINNADKTDSYYTKNTSLSALDKENEIDWHEVREVRFFRKDAKTNAGYKDPLSAAEEMMEFADISYYEILEAEFVQEHKTDPIWLRVKFLSDEVNVKRKPNRKRLEQRRGEDGCFIKREL